MKHHRNQKPARESGEVRPQRPIRLFDGLVQILVQPFLFNQNMGGGNCTVNKAGVVKITL